MEDKKPYVDMGNGVLWATSNITRTADGNYKLADNPEDFGCYFSWGDVVGHNSTEYNDRYSFSSDNYSSGTSGRGYSLTAGDIPSGNPTYDAATATLGGNWRMPTYEEFKWLVGNCNPKWKTLHGVKGELFTNPNAPSKTLFFPAAGYYSGTRLYSSGSYGAFWPAKYDGSSSACNLVFNSSNCYVIEYCRYFGYSVRGVMNIND